MPTTTKTFSIKSGKMNASDGKEWIELIEERGDKEIKHRIFKNAQRADESWVSLKDEVEILKEKIGNNEIEGMPISLIKEKRGEYWNVVGVEFEPIVTKENTDVTPRVTAKPRAEYRGRDEDKVDMRTAVMEIGADYRAGKIEKTNPLIVARNIWLMRIMDITETKPTEEKKILLSEIKAVMDECNWSEKDALNYCKSKKWNVKTPKELDQAQRKELAEHIKKNPK